MWSKGEDSSETDPPAPQSLPRTARALAFHRDIMKKSIEKADSWTLGDGSENAS